MKRISLCFLAFLLSFPVYSQSNFEALWQGNFSNWTELNTQANEFSLVGDFLHVEGGDGWLKSDDVYGDFILKSEFRWLTDDADSGFYIRAQADEEFIRGWPGNSYQVQIRNPRGESRFPPVGGLFRHGTAEGETSLDEVAVESAFLGTGQWHTIEISVMSDTVTIELNGTEIARGNNILNSPAYIGVQAEFGVTEFKTIEIEVLD